MTDVRSLREFIIVSGRAIPVPSVDRGQLLLGDPERWFRALADVTLRWLVRLLGIRLGVLVPIALLLLAFGQWRLSITVLALFLGIYLLSVLAYYYLFVVRSIDAYRSSGLCPGLFGNGLELPTCVTVKGTMRARVGIPSLPWTMTVFLPYAECEDIDTEGGTLAGFIQDTAMVRLNGGNRLWFPARFLGEDGLDRFRASLRMVPRTTPGALMSPHGPVAEDGPWTEVRAP